MAKLPEDRYRTAGEFAKALAASASAPLQAANPALVPGSGRLTTAAVVLGLLLVGGLGGVVVLGVLSDKSNPTTAPGTAGPPSSLVAGAAPTAPPTSATAPPTSATAGTPSPGFSPTPAPTTRPGRSPRPTHTAGANPSPQPATPTPPGPSPSPPPLDLPIVADGSWSVDNSPSGISGDPYVVVGAHQRRYRIVSHCLSETDCRIAVKTFDADSGASLGSISFRWNGDSYVFRGSARWYSRSGGSTCETSPGVLIDGAYTTGEQVHVAPRTNAGGLVVEMTGSKTITGTPTAAGSAAGCQPFSMTYDVDMNLSP